MRTIMAAAIEDESRPIAARPYYAYDTTELYGFAYPSDGELPRFFERDSIETRVVLQAAYYDEAFFSNTEPALLLPPYALELQTLARLIIERDYMAHASRVIASLGEVSSNNVTLSSEVTRIADTAIAGGTLTEDEVFELLSACRSHLPQTVELLLMRGAKPSQRLRHLVQSAELKDISTSADVNRAANDELVVRWERRLVRRHQHAAAIDALAMSLVKVLNNRLGSVGRSVKLVTRSKHMQRLYSEEVEQGLWPEPHSDILRSPESIIVRSLIRHMPQGIEQVSHLSDAIGLVLTAAVDEDFGHVPGQLVSGFLGVRSKWRELTSQVSWVATLDDRHGAGQPPESEQHNLIALALTGSEQLRSALIRQLGSTAASLRRDYEAISVAIRPKGELGGAALSVDFWSNAAKLVIRGAASKMPYTLQFHSPEVRDIVREFGLGRKPLDILKWAEAPLSNGFSYEALLCIGYLFGTAGEWELAAGFANAARFELKEDDGRPHESFFLEAVARRKLASSKEELTECLALLESAGAEKRLSRGADYEDPRYLKERSTVLFISDSEGWAGGEFGETPSQAAIELSELALGLADDDAMLRLESANNLCYYGVTHARPELLSKYLPMLLDALRQGGDVVLSLPISIIDTLVAVEIIRPGTLKVTDVSLLVARAESDLNDESLPERERKLVRGHLEALKRRAASRSGAL